MSSTRKLDYHQQRAIECDRNAVVSAGAGSGKTTVLAERYVRLVREGRAGVENILTLTFTRKAAYEMHERIFRLMLSYRNDPTIRQQLELFNRAQISTLDSFCSQIARNWSQRFGIAADFSVDEEAAANAARRIALELMLENSENDALLRFVSANGFLQVLDGYFTSLAVSVLSVAQPLDFQGMWDRQKEILEQVLDENTGNLTDCVGQIQSLDPKAGTSITKAQAATLALMKIEDMVREGNFSGISEVLSGFSYRMPGNVTKPELVTLKELTVALRNALEVVGGAAITMDSEAVIHGLFGITGEYQNRIIDDRRETGVVFYHDVVEMALICLLENKSLRNYYKSKYSHIMIDEFQDNNRLQKELLYLLAEKLDLSLDRVPTAAELEPAKLFFVGDEKQSIYKFRGADVSVFKELSDEIGEHDGEAVSLPRNYRAEPGLIDFYNGVFSKVMELAEKPFEARFEGLEKREARLSGSPTIDIFYKQYSPDSEEDVVDSSDAEAIAIARYIDSIVKDKALQVADESGVRPADYQDFAILMRSTSNQSRFERALRLYDVPYLVQNTRTLFLEAPANDIYSVLQLAVYPDDRKAYAAVLRSPFVNLSDESVIRILLERFPPFDARLLELPLPAEDRRKIEKGAELYSYVTDNSDRIPIAEMLFALWHEYGYRYYLLRNPAGHPHVEHYDYLVELARKADRNLIPLARFLDEMRPHLGKFERIQDMEILKDSGGGVQIMTVHRSKGLEFPVVILANAGNTGRNSDMASPYYYVEPYGVTVHMRGNGGDRSRAKYNYFYEIGRNEQKEQERAELKRMLYVALTRAQYHLIISGCHNRNNKGKDDSLLNMVLSGLGWEPGVDVLESAALSPFVKEIPDVHQSVLFGSKPKTNDAMIQGISKTYRESRPPVYPRKGLEVTATVLEEALFTPDGPERKLPSLAIDAIIRDDELEAAFGSMCHTVISWKISSIYDPERLPTALREILPKTDFGVAVKTAEDLADGFFESSFPGCTPAMPSGQALKAAVSVESEVEFLHETKVGDEQVFIRGVIDLLVELDDRLVILDFKTNRAVKPGEYSTQLNIYRSAVREWTDKRIECYLLYLRDGTLQEVKDQPTMAVGDTIERFINKECDNG